MVINDTRVIPARLRGHKLPGGGTVEILLLKEIDPMTWEAIVGGKGLIPGRKIQFTDSLSAIIAKDLGGPQRLVRFSAPVSPMLDEIGEMPLPPYIHTPLQDRDEYQTTFASRPGSAAAPTAGLHFTPEMLANLESAGIEILPVTLHVGLDTFAPVHEDDPKTHRIHTEWCSLSSSVAGRLNEIKAHGGRVFAVGTTSVRTLESAHSDQGVSSFEGSTDLFILPGFHFNVVDAMLTNFHLPRSTLLMLVSAFAGRERILAVYAEAINQEYCFYSFGDAMLIL